MASSIYNELKLAMIDKIAEINDSILQTSTAQAGISGLSSKAIAVRDNKSTLDEAFFSVKDVQIACIGMMLVCGITKVYANINSMVIDAIVHRNTLMQNTKKIKPFADELLTIYLSGSLFASLNDKKDELITTINSYKDIFTSIKLDEYTSSNKPEIYNISVIDDIRNAINLRCDDINSLTLYDDHYIMGTVNIDATSKPFPYLFGLGIAELDDPIDKLYNSLKGVFKGSIQIIIEICSNIFSSIENMPVDYNSEIFQDFMGAYSELTNLENLFDTDSDITGNDSFNKYRDYISSGISVLNSTFIGSYEMLKKSIEICDRYECMCSAEKNAEYYNKIICMIDDTYHFIIDRVDDFCRRHDEDNMGIGYENQKLFANPILTDSINFKYNINSLLSVSPNCKKDYNIEIAEKIAESEKLLKDYQSAIKNEEATEAEKATYRTNIETLTTYLDNIGESIAFDEKNATENKRFYRISFADPISYALSVLNVFHKALFNSEYIDIRNYVVKRLSMSGFIERKDNDGKNIIDENGRNAWEFMTKFKTLPYSETINDGIIPVVIKELSFMNNIDMRPFLQKVIGESNVTEYGYEDLTKYHKFVNYFNKIKETSKLFEDNTALDFRVLTVILKNYYSKISTKELFATLSECKNMRSQIAATLVFLHALDIFYDENKLPTHDKDKKNAEKASAILIDFGNIEEVFNFVSEYINQSKFYSKENIDDAFGVSSTAVVVKG